MADIGCVPQREALRLTSSTGGHTTIKPATKSAAGCMGAEQAKQLSHLWAVHETEGGGSLIVEAVDTSNLVTHTQLKTALMALPKVQQALQARAEQTPHLDAANLDRIKQLERVVAEVRDSKTAGNDGSNDVSLDVLQVVEGLATAIDAVDKRVKACELIENHLAQAIEALSMAVTIGFEAEKVKEDPKPTPEKYPAFSNHFELTALHGPDEWQACVETYEIKVAS